MVNKQAMLDAFVVHTTSYVELNTTGSAKQAVRYDQDLLEGLWEIFRLLLAKVCP
jgi:hypothetical protein